MATNLENLEARKAKITARLAAMDEGDTGDKPDASKSGVGHVDYRRSLLDELKTLNELIDQEKAIAIQDAGGYEGLMVGMV